MSHVSICNVSVINALNKPWSYTKTPRFKRTTLRQLSTSPNLVQRKVCGVL